MSKYACNVCKVDYPDSQTLIRHFSAEHATTKCHLCNRESVADKGSFCPTCRKAFPGEIANLESEQELRLKIEQSLKQLDKKISSQQAILRERFLARQRELFCAHGKPKEDPCEKCDAPRKDLSVARPIIRIKLDDGEIPIAGTMRKTKNIVRSHIRVNL